MKNQLNEQLSRIKQMMNSIQEQSFDMKKEEGPSDEIKQKVLSALQEFATTHNNFGDAECDLNDGWFEISAGDDEYVKFTFDVDVTGWPSFTPGRSYMSNGDIGYPDEGEPLEWSPENVRIEFMTTTQNEEGKWVDQIIYEGADFIDVLNYKLSFKGSGGSVGSWLFDMFDEKLQNMAMDRD